MPHFSRAAEAQRLRMRNAMKASETKFILLHCPQDLVREVDDLCAMNFLNRTEFLVFAIDSMMEFFERRQQAEDARSGLDDEVDFPIPGDVVPGAFFTGEDDDEEVLWAAEEQEGFSADFSWPWAKAQEGAPSNASSTPSAGRNASDEPDAHDEQGASGSQGSGKPGIGPSDDGR